jgi:hypothetical protein
MKICYTTLAMLLLLVGLNSCQKENLQPEEGSKTISAVNNNMLTIEKAREWFESQNEQLIASKLPIRWDRAKSIPAGRSNRIILPLPGQPSIMGIKMGYRQLSIQIDPDTKQIQGRYLEIIPNYLYHQAKQRVQAKDFSGQILAYDLSYKLIEGKVYQNGKQIGQIQPDRQATDTAQIRTPDRLNQIAEHVGPFDYPIQNSGEKTMRMQAITSCAWVQSWYVDAENILNIVNNQVCHTSYFDVGTPSYLDSGINTDYSTGGGGGGTSTSPPAPSNIPGENNPKVDPKKMMDCFSAVKTEGAAFQVKVLVIEPFPGTTFNYGPNSFGHVAIQLTKTNGNQSVTQVLGFYGSGTGLDKMISSSEVLNNGRIDYTMEASYFTDATNFDKIIAYVSNPKPNYHYTNFNCSAFVYEAGIAGGLNIPDPMTTVGMSGPGGAGAARTPAGMASALRTEKANGAKNVAEGGGTAPASKGECN